MSLALVPLLAGLLGLPSPAAAASPLAHGERIHPYHRRTATLDAEPAAEEASSQPWCSGLLNSSHLCSAPPAKACRLPRLCLLSAASACPRPTPTSSSQWPSGPPPPSSFAAAALAVVSPHPLRQVYVYPKEELLMYQRCPHDFDSWRKVGRQL